METITTHSAQIINGAVHMTHINIGLIILAIIAFIAIAIIFIKNCKKILSLISGSVKDPITGQWSPKILTAFSISAMINLSHIVWLKFAFVNNDFSQLQPILIIDYAYLGVAYGLRTMEKMQDAKINKPDENKKEDVKSS